MNGQENILETCLVVSDLAKVLIQDVTDKAQELVEHVAQKAQQLGEYVANKSQNLPEEAIEEEMELEEEFIGLAMGLKEEFIFVARELKEGFIAQAQQLSEQFTKQTKQLEQQVWNQSLLFKETSLKESLKIQEKWEGTREKTKKILDISKKSPQMPFKLGHTSFDGEGALLMISGIPCLFPKGWVTSEVYTMASQIQMPTQTGEEPLITPSHNTLSVEVTIAHANTQESVFFGIIKALLILTQKDSIIKSLGFKKKMRVPFLKREFTLNSKLCTSCSYYSIYQQVPCCLLSSFFTSAAPHARNQEIWKMEFVEYDLSGPRQFPMQKILKLAKEKVYIA